MAPQLIDLRPAALDEYPEFGCAQPLHRWWTNGWFWAAVAVLAVDIGLCVLALLWRG